MEIVLIVCIFSTSVCSITVAFSFLLMMRKMPNLPQEGNTDEICLPEPLPGNMYGDIRCQKRTEGLAQYLKAKAELSYESCLENHGNGLKEDESHIELKFYRPNRITDMKPRARLVAKRSPNDIEDKSSELTPFKNWYQGRRLSTHGGFRQYGIQIRNGRLVVPVAGLYELYSFFVFHEPCKPETGEPDIRLLHEPIKHSIFKFDITEGHETEIVSGIQPHTISKSLHYNSYSSYISSVVSLKAGDQLAVKAGSFLTQDDSKAESSLRAFVKIFTRLP